MKTHIIQLDTHDDHISIRDKMSWAKSPRILLVWPDLERVAIRPLDLKLLERHATSLGAQLGLVTRDAKVHRAAAELDIPVFTNTSKAHQHRWKRTREEKLFLRRHPRQNLRKAALEARLPEAAWRDRPSARMIFFTIGVLAMLALALSLLPSARIQLALETESQTFTIPISAHPGTSQPSPSGEIPLQQIVISTSAVQEVVASGRALVPATKSKGNIQFRNLTESSILIPAGTVILTLDSIPVRFVTTKSAEVPGGIDQTANVTVEAEQPGSMGNVAAESLQAIEGALGLSLAVTNPEATSGGADRRETVLTDSDRSRARQTLLAMLQEQASEQGKQMLSSGDLPLPITVVDVNMLEEDAIQIEDSSSYTYKLSGDVVFFYAPASALAWLGDFIFTPSLPEGYQAVPDTLSYEIVGNPAMGDAGNILFDLQFGQQIHPQIDLYELIQSIRGRNPKSAQRQLQVQLAFIQGSSIRMTPSWWPWLPLFPFRYEITY